jgi:DNA (cytosine-5)-methyltransferase 1
MRFLSVCSGIEAASVAWNPLGWKAVAFSEIEPFPCAVLAHHYPDTPNWGDMTKYQEWPDATVDLLCGGTPCQSFSNAGLRAGLDDPRGQLMLTFGAIAAKYRPRWLVWENVPGVLSSSGGRDFGSFLGMLGQLGYGFAYRVLDAQYVRVDGYGRAVPQRRNRVFVVGCLGDWRRAAAVLLERESLRGDLAPRREAGARVAATLTRGADSSGKGGYAGRRQEDDYNIVAGALSSSQGGADDNSAQAHHLVAFGGGNTTGAIDVATCLTHHGMRQDFDSETFIAHAFDARQSDVIQYGDMTGPLDTDGSSIAVAVGPWVRRLMPIECERLQGFPDDYTRVPFRGKPAADGPRYKAIGNSWSANCPRWIGRRIAIVDRIAAQQRLAA